MEKICIKNQLERSQKKIKPPYNNNFKFSGLAQHDLKLN
jgi:hypothetical protein